MKDPVRKTYFVPPELHKRLEIQAALAGKNVSELVVEALEQILAEERPYTSRQAGEMLNRSVGWIQQVAQEHGIGRLDVFDTSGRGVRRFSSDDVEQMRGIKKYNRLWTSNSKHRGKFRNEKGERRSLPQLIQEVILANGNKWVSGSEIRDLLKRRNLAPEAKNIIQRISNTIRRADFLQRDESVYPKLVRVKEDSDEGSEEAGSNVRKSRR